MKFFRLGWSLRGSDGEDATEMNREAACFSGRSHHMGGKGDRK